MDPDNLELSLVAPMKPSIIHDGQEDVEDCTDIPSFTNGLLLVEEIDDLDDDSSHLLRLDVEWTRVEKSKTNKKNKTKKQKNLEGVLFFRYLYISYNKLYYRIC